MKKSQYIPPPKVITKPSLWSRIVSKVYPASFYVGRLKIQFDSYGAVVYTFGVKYYPQYKQFEINFGRLALNFWYRGKS